MTTRVRILPGPEADAAGWLEGLNACFAGWGGRERFDWCFRRPGAGRIPDAVFFEEDGRAVAGAGVVYRRLELADGRSEVVAIMSGAWTLPGARGRGAFTRLVEATREAGAARGAALFVGFVTEGNASRRRLDALGALMVPSVYARSAGAPRLAPSLETIADPSPANFASPPGLARFVYEEEEWRAQFVNRPGPVRAVGAAEGIAALLEESADFRVLALSADHEAAGWASCAAHAARAGHAAFAFATRESAIRALAAAGYEIATRGFVGFLPCAAPSVAEALGAADEAAARALLDLDLQDGDRM